MARIKLTVCPTCYSKNLKKVRRTVTGTRPGRRYSAPGVEFYECPDCGEQIYDPTAMRQIDQHSRAGGRTGLRRQLSSQDNKRSCVWRESKPSAHPKARLDTVKHPGFTHCGELNLFGMVEAQIRRGCPMTATDWTHRNLC